MQQSNEELPPLTPSAHILREVAVIGERVGGLKEAFDDFRRETRENFDRARERDDELRTELKTETSQIRQEMHDGFKEDRTRLDSLEATRDTSRGGFAVSKWVIGAIGTAAGAVLTFLGKILA